MTGRFIITRQHLAELGACKGGMAFFDRTYPAGQAEYQDMLDQAVKAGYINYAEWLLNKVGATDDTLELEIVNDPDLDIVFAGQIEISLGANLRGLICGRGIKAGRDISAGWYISVGGSIKSGEGISAGEGIKAGHSISAGEGIKAGYSIKAGRGIKAGRDISAGYGIEAGYSIKAGHSISAGEGIKAGLYVKPTDWKVQAIVTAKTKPENLISGYWKEVN